MKTPNQITEEYGLVILGSGAAGKLISWTLAKKGMKTAVVERKYTAVPVPNIACLPSKNIIHSAKVASYYRSRAGTHRPQRNGGERTRRCLSPRQNPDARSAPDSDAFETRGFMKALIDTTRDRILGITVFGVAAGEIIATVQVAMLAGLPYTALRDAIFTHPTMNEGLIPLFASVPPLTQPVSKTPVAAYE